MAARLFRSSSPFPVGVSDSGYDFVEECRNSLEWYPSPVAQLQNSVAPVQGISIPKQEADVDTSLFCSEIWQPPQYNFNSSSCNSSQSAVKGDSLVSSFTSSVEKLNEAYLVLTTNSSSNQQTSSRKWGPIPSQDKALGVQHKWMGKRPLAQRENHIWSERERRKGMNRLFCILRSLLPEPTSKTDKSTVVGEIIRYINTLLKTIEELSSRQSALLQKTISLQKSYAGNSLADMTSTFVSTPLVALHVCADNVFVNLSCNSKPSLFINVLRAMRQHQLIVLNATVSVQDLTTIYCIHTKVPMFILRSFKLSNKPLSVQAMDINHFARESLQSALLSITQPSENE